MIPVVIVDDEEQVCHYLRQILETTPDLRVVGHALDGLEGVELVRRIEPRVVIMDVRMAGTDGLSAMETMASLRPSPAVLLFTNFNDERAVARGMRAGAAGVLLKSTAPADLVATVRLIAGGHQVLGAGVKLPCETQPDPAARRDAFADLTAREQDVLILLGEGLSNKEIGRRMELSQATVKGHVSSLMTKLGCASRLQLGVIAVRSSRAPSQNGGIG